MTENTDAQTLGVQFANQFINMANKRLEEGMRPDVIATGMRHAAANFSAFVASHTAPETLEDGTLTNEFAHMLDYYAERHSREAAKPQPGLMNLVQQVKDESGGQGS